MKKGAVIFSTCFIAPALLIYTLFVMIPTLASAYYSLTEWNGIGAKIFVGLDNYIELFQDADYLITFKNTMLLVFYSLIFQVPVGLLMAYLLFRGLKGFKFFRTVYFLPVVIAPIAIGLMFSLFYNSEFGLFNQILESIGLGAWQKSWLSDMDVLLYAVMAPQVWQYIGLYIVIFLAALQSVPEEVLESAQMDGAGPFRTFFMIVVPMIWEVVFICIVLSLTGSLKSFDHSWIMTMGGPGVRSAYLGVYMYKTAFINSSFGLGSAISVTIVGVSLLFTVLFKKIANKTFA
ncbi:sugar ABC transporter permease [Paenibacillaceae bacterium]|nr:sugar ABC transporter permease [Paenibacillaceae bacterium]